MQSAISISKKLFTILLSVLLISTMSFSTFADENFSSILPLPKWTYISLVAGGVQPADSNGKHKVGGDVILLDPSNRVELRATVQRYNGDWYNTSYSWSNSGYGIASVTERIYLNTGTYRMRLIVKVYSPTGVLLEETTLYTDETII